MYAFKSIFVPLTWLCFSTSPVHALQLRTRDVSKVQAALSTVNQDAIGLLNACNSYTGGFSGAVPVQNAAKKLNDDFKSATTTVNANAAATEAEAQQVLNYINNTLCPNIEKVVQCLRNKKSQFTAAGLKNTVLNTLKDIQTNLYALFDALIAKVPSSQKSAVQAARTKCTQYVQAGISDYSS